MHTLILGPDYQPMSYLPLSTIHWQQAVKLFFLDKVTVLHWYDNWAVRSAKLTIRVPAVVVSRSTYKKYRQTVAFTRNNIFLRDMYQCGYCSDLFNPHDLTIDHIVPRSRGGSHSWTNVITACKKCNHNKGDRLWEPLWSPTKPDYYKIANSVRKVGADIRHPSWRAYLSDVEAA
jgi:5-methylcytosine-specific restriction endonuclease McrA